MGKAAVGRLEMKILGLTGDPQKSDEVHLHVTGEGIAQLTIVVHDPRKYRSEMFKPGNIVVLTEKRGTLQLQEVYSGRNHVYSAAKG